MKTKIEKKVDTQNDMDDGFCKISKFGFPLNLGSFPTKHYIFSWFL